jgi:uncharacterized glyoxalase superfamily protein PhnB
MLSPSASIYARASASQPGVRHYAFLERAFGFREIPTARGLSPAGVVGHSMVEVGDSIIGIGTQGAHGAFSPKTAGTASHYISVYIDDIDAHYERARDAGAQIASTLHDHRTDYRAYEAFDVEGHRWRFVQWRREVTGSRTKCSYTNNFAKHATRQRVRDRWRPWNVV